MCLETNSIFLGLIGEKFQGSSGHKLAKSGPMFLFLNDKSAVVSSVTMKMYGKHSLSASDVYSP